MDESITVDIPKDLDKIKTKVIFNLTKRQLICFSCAAMVGIPFYFLTRETLGTQISTIFMVLIMVPFFIVAIYEKNGFPAEKWIYFMVRQKFLTKGIRLYKSQNLYTALEEKEKMEKEVKYLETKAGNSSAREKRHSKK